jgi:hypothetical protein
MNDETVADDGPGKCRFPGPDGQPCNLVELDPLHGPAEPDCSCSDAHHDFRPPAQLGEAKGGSA